MIYDYGHWKTISTDDIVKDEHGDLFTSGDYEWNRLKPFGKISCCSYDEFMAIKEDG